MDIPLHCSDDHLAQAFDLDGFCQLWLDHVADFGQHLASQYQFWQEVLAALKAFTNNCHSASGIIKNLNGVLASIQSLLGNPVWLMP